MGGVTKVARAEEEERLARLARLQQEELPGFDLLLNLISSSSLPCCCIAFGIMCIFRAAEDEPNCPQPNKENKVDTFSIINLFSPLPNLIKLPI